MDFEKAAGLVPYLARLGISHLYASPLFQAMPGSTHGYDVTDHGKFDESLGGRDGFRQLSARLGEHGLGLILDIVPNHMAADCNNPWWADVLRNGRRSAYADHFDIDWSEPKVLLPILGAPYGEALAAGEFSLGHDEDGLVWHASGQALPIDPITWPLILRDFRTTTPNFEVGPDSFRDWRSAENVAALDAHLSAISHDAARMHQIHEAQVWRIAYWRAARDMLSYRRFFEVSDLVGVRVEDPKVFDDVHRFLFELVAEGAVEGLRIDHVDGLADPDGYLAGLVARLPRPVPIWVEKILEHDENLPTAWPVAGTTGYEFLAMTTAALTNGAAEPELSRAYATFTGLARNYEAMLDAAKREILTRNLAAELATLVRQLQKVFNEDLSQRDWGGDTLRRAIIALLVAMPVYRTYFTAAGGTERDRSILADAVTRARHDPGLDDPMVVDSVADCLTAQTNPAARAFCVRFQQVSGALLAKAMEDTLFYRFNRLISANEVGAAPEKLSLEKTAFLARAAARGNAHPMSLNATATHDTKRGEDSRMRIAAISQAPERWIQAVDQFEAALAADQNVPEIDANTKWLFYQALLGSWRPGLKDDLPERVGAFLLKAARERQVRTSWVKEDRRYEDRLSLFVDGALSCDEFLGLFDRHSTEFVEIGSRKSLAQLALKLTLPGVPDIYQGTEFTDLSFVDPDNRRPVDFDSLDRRLATIGETVPRDLDEQKLGLLCFGLRLRRTRPDVFAGDCQPLPDSEDVKGHQFAFARRGASGTLIVAIDTSGTATAVVDMPAHCQLGKLIETFPPGDGIQSVPLAPGRSRLAAKEHNIALFLFSN